MIFNSYKDNLVELIADKINQIEEECCQLSYRIYQYSDERLQKLNSQSQNINTHIKQLQVDRKPLRERLNTLKNEAKYLQQLQTQQLEQIQQKKKQNRNIQRKIVYLQQKYKEQAPFIHSFQQQKTKSSSNNSKIKYAKQKIQSINNKIYKECSQIQYQYRLNKILKDKLRSYKNISNQQQNDKQARKSQGTAADSSDHGTPFAPYQKPIQGIQTSEYNLSITTSFRQN